MDETTRQAFAGRRPLADGLDVPVKGTPLRELEGATGGNGSYSVDGSSGPLPSGSSSNPQISPNPPPAGIFTARVVVIDAAGDPSAQTRTFLTP